jgi:hypothetical protein
MQLSTHPIPSKPLRPRNTIHRVDKLENSRVLTYWRFQSSNDQHVISPSFLERDNESGFDEKFGRFGAF